MRLFDKRTPLQKEWDKLEVQEQRFLRKRLEKKESILNQKLEEKIPPKLQGTLDAAFAKAFALIFEKGTGVIEKTYQREKLEQDYQVRQYTADVKQDSKSLRAFSKKARDTGTKNLLLSGASGIGHVGRICKFTSRCIVILRDHSRIYHSLIHGSQIVKNRPVIG